MEATKLLDALTVCPRAKRATAKLLGMVLVAGGPVPSVAPADNGQDVLLYWKAGPISLEVEVSADGPIYVWARDETGETHCVEGGDSRTMAVIAQGVVARMATKHD